jgi:Type I phosphodiesterase / nucleotide pyrophosphatase
MDICRRRFGTYILGSLAAKALALPPRPKLLVLLVIEQFRPDYLDDVWGQIGRGGLRRLIENGVYFPDCRHLALSYTSSTLATMATGAWPSQHGIVADTWYDPAAGKPVRGSAEDLRATTLAAQIAASEGARVYVCSLDPLEGALFAGTPGAQLFWMNDEGRFATRGPEGGPTWLEDFNQAKPVERLRNAPWVAVGAGPGVPPLRKLTYDPARPQEFLELYKASPFAQASQIELVAELAQRAQLGQSNSFDFVAVLLGSSALLGYETGALSPLMHQTALQLDRQVEFLLGQLDRMVGANMYNVVLAAGHGAPPAPDPRSRSRMAVNGELLAQGIQQRLTQGGNGRVARYLYPFLYLDTQGFAMPETSRQAAGRAALEQPPVAAYYSAGGDCSVHDEWERRFRNSFYPGRAGDVMLSYRPEYVEDFGLMRGISYGSLYNYDIRTPLCFYGPQFRARVFEHPVEAVDIAPTLARAMGVASPSSSSGRVLGEAFAGTEDAPR